MCKITGRRRHSKDLAQGGLEIPCTLTFEGGSKDITKVEKLIKKSLAIPAQQEETSADKKHPSEYASEHEPLRKKTRTWIDEDVETETNRGSFHTLMVFSQQSCKQRRASGSGNRYLTNFR